MGQAKIKRKNLKPSAQNVGKMLAAQHKHIGCCEPGERCDEFKKEITTPSESAALEALKQIRNRSFSGRHLDLGKMIKCQVCNLRHRESIVHKQIFTKRWAVINGEKVYTEEQFIAGQTPETESIIESRRVRLSVGALVFKGKRRKPPLNKRANEFVQLVRSFLPDEYTHEELEKARAKSRRVLARKYGRHGFLPPKWQSKKEDHEDHGTATPETVQTD